MMAIPKYPQYPYPYLTTFVSPTKEIPIETTMMNAETKALRTGTFYTFCRNFTFSKRFTNPKMTQTALEIKHKNNTTP